MAGKTGFTFNGVDFNDIYVRSEYFTSGGLWAWGSSTDGRLGDNTIINKSSPVQTVAGGTNWKSIGDFGFSAGTAPGFTAVIKSDGTLWTWGQNSYGQLGDNTTISKSSPVQTVSGGTNWKQVAGSYRSMSAIKTDGTLWTWGLNDNGQLGDNTRINRSSPIQTVASGANWKFVGGGNYTTYAIKTDGTLWLWGSGSSGELGDNSTISKSSPVQTVSGGTNWKLVQGGQAWSCALKTDGTLWTWGSNVFNQLGDNTAINRSSPVQTIAAGSNWKQISAGRWTGAGIKNDGTLWLWGSNSTGNLGDNTRTNRSSPVQTIAGGQNWKQVSAGDFQTGAIKSDGTLWTWGNGPAGALGDNTSISKSSPVQTIAGGTNWKQVKVGSAFMVAIRDQW